MTCKKADQKQITKQKGNPDAFGKQGVPGFVQSFKLNGGDGLFDELSPAISKGANQNQAW